MSKMKTVVSEEADRLHSFGASIGYPDLKVQAVCLRIPFRTPSVCLSRNTLSRFLENTEAFTKVREEYVHSADNPPKLSPYKLCLFPQRAECAYSENDLKLSHYAQIRITKKDLREAAIAISASYYSDKCAYVYARTIARKIQQKLDNRLIFRTHEKKVTSYAFMFLRKSNGKQLAECAKLVPCATDHPRYRLVRVECFPEISTKISIYFYRPGKVQVMLRSPTKNRVCFEDISFIIDYIENELIIKT